MTTERQSIFLLLVIFGMAVLVGFHHSPPEDTEPSEPTQNQTLKPVAQSFTQSPLLQIPRKKIEFPTLAQDVSPACSLLWNDLRSLDLRNPSEAQTNLPASDACQAVPEILKSVHLAFYQQCQSVKKLGAEATPDQRDKCLSATIQYRAEVTAWLTKDTPLDQISDPVVLSDKLVVSFGKDMAEAAATADRLREVAPDFYPATKASLVTHFLLNASNPSPDLDIRQEANLLDAARAANQQDAELPFIDVAIPMRSGRLEEVVQAADRLEQTEPGSPAAAFARSFVEFKQGNSAKAIQQLDEAARRSSQPAMRDYFSNLKTAIAQGAQRGSLAYYIPMSFGMSAGSSR